jgi:hypothetical protein
MLITYDLNRETVRPNIVGAIKALGSWAKLSESSYAVNVSMTVEQVYGTLKPLLDANDRMYIVTLKKPWAGYGPKEVNDWLDSNLTY